jgi:hypothetical protein
MYRKISFLLLLVIHTISSQKTFPGIVIDKETLVPLEFVDIYNQENNTSTNEDGRFMFTSKIDSIKFSLLGYNSFSTTFSDIKSDTILLESNAIELKEIILTDENYLYKKLRENIAKNYPLNSYKEKFFLRGIVKRNDTIVRIEDFLGLIERKTLFATREIPMPKKNYSIELLNLRKAGIVEKDVYFKEISFKKLLDLFVTLGLQKELFEFKEINLQDNFSVKLEFSSKKNETFSTQGYYLINSEDYAIDEFYLISKKGFPLIEKKYIQYRTVLHESRIKFKKNKKYNKYYIYKAELDFKVEIQIKGSEKEYYDVSYRYFTSNNFDNFNIKKNVSEHKDLFKINYKYDATYWNSQNQLLLTREMEEFLKTLDDENNEFRINSNMN